MDRRQGELIAIVLTVLGKFICMDVLEWRLPFVLTALVGWFTYLLFQIRRSPQLPKHWGFRKDTFVSVLKRVAPFGVVAVGLCFGIGYVRGSLHLSWHIIPLLFLYPIWGTIQHFLMMALVAGNLQDLNHKRLSPALIILLSGLFFGGIHFPHYDLMIGTTLLAWFYSYQYLKERNLYVLGIFHGWLGAVFYYTLTTRDPFLEMFGNL